MESESSYLSDEAIMIEIIRDHIRVTQYRFTMIRCYKFQIRIGLRSNLLHEFQSDFKSYFHLKFILRSVMKLEKERESKKILERENFGERK